MFLPFHSNLSSSVGDPDPDPRIRMFLSYLDLLVRGTDPEVLSSSKNIKKNLVSYCFVTFL
jgi:hypothetical protein